MAITYDVERIKYSPFTDSSYLPELRARWLRTIGSSRRSWRERSCYVPGLEQPWKSDPSLRPCQVPESCTATGSIVEGIEHTYAA